jgi:hypothetical protein
VALSASRFTYALTSRRTARDKFTTTPGGAASCPEFAQRSSATLGHDPFEGLRSSPARGDWLDDLKVTYRRRD